MTLPNLSVPQTPKAWDKQVDLASRDWTALPSLPAFILTDGSAPAGQQTVARVCHDSQALYVRYDCDDRDIWGTYTRGDDPICDEEVVELFLAPSDADPSHHYEFKVSPNGVLLDAKIHNPTSQRADLEVDTSWDCSGLSWRAGRHEALNQCGRCWSSPGRP